MTKHLLTLLLAFVLAVYADVFYCPVVNPYVSALPLFYTSIAPDACPWGFWAPGDYCGDIIRDWDSACNFVCPPPV